VQAVTVAGSVEKRIRNRVGGAWVMRPVDKHLKGIRGIFRFRKHHDAGLYSTRASLFTHYDHLFLLFLVGRNETVVERSLLAVPGRILL
jgi:hypothetical protein